MAIHYSQRPPDFGPDAACSGLECAVAGALNHLFVFAWLGLLGVVVGLTYLSRARDRCEEERRRTRFEVRAFDEFASRVADVEPAPPREPAGRLPATGSATATAAGVGPDDAGLRAVREAYRETVMSVPHYEEEYDEAFTESVAAEFDPEAAVALQSVDRLTPQIKRGLVQSATDARDSRRRFLVSLDREANSLEEASASLGEIEARLERLDDRPLPDRSFDELRETWQRLRDLGADLEAILEDRQAEVRSGKNCAPGFPDPWAMADYLYGPIGCTHPVLADGARLLETLSTAEDRVLQSLTARV